MTDPYKSPPEEESLANGTRSTSVETGQPLSKWFTVPTGTIFGALLAALVAGGLAFSVLASPWSRQLGLGGEFAGLLVFGLPLLALPGGALGGVVLACIWKRKNDWLIALFYASLPAFAYFFIGAWQHGGHTSPRDQFVATTVCAICLILASAISLKLLDSAFVVIERYKHSDLPAH